MLNSSLSVQAGRPQSHSQIGWEIFTNRVIEIINDELEEIIFLLWGSSAQKKGSIINPQKHHILKTTHPSPLSAHRGFLGCGHFSQVNSILKAAGEKNIDWQIKD